MKKRLLIAIIASLTVMSGCASKETSSGDISTSDSASEVTEAATETATVANPWVDSDEETIAEKFNYCVYAPEGASDVKCQINDSDSMGQMTFKYGEPEQEYTYRVKKASQFEDISGLYYEWTAIEKQQIGWCDGECRRYIGEDETIDVCQWYDENVGLMYSLSTSAPDLEGYDITALVYQFFIPEDESEIFMPANFLEAKLEKDTFTSFDEIISSLDAGNGYAVTKVYGLEDDVLMITDGTYDNLDGNMATIDASVYVNDNGTIRCAGNVFSNGTAYPISLDAEGRIYSGGHHEIEISAIAKETKNIMNLVFAHETFDENQNVTYSGFVREKNSFSDDGTDIAADDPSVLEQCFQDYVEATTPVNFTVIK